VLSDNQFDLSGRLAVVTGARRGIGAGIAEALAAAGADVIGVSASMEDSGSPVQKAVESHGRTFTPYRADLSDQDAVCRLTEQILARHGTVDILVNNGGDIRRSPAIAYSDSDWDYIVQVDLTSQFVLARELGRGMVEKGAGKIIFTASLLSFQGGINVVAYTAAKSGVAGVVKALANEWASHGVNVNAVAPGYIATDNTAALRADAGRFKAISDRIPAARWGTPADIGGAVVFLASRAADYVHGVTLPVDGGWLGR
jgi:2-deoxy-D-gluconate 3-dehydrogenase